ncbi:MDR family NADPH-dependent oxidoreductase [Luteolibacter sp. AS25]|uniref:MDR family NADPH-dependent oxidoreductase n=1 Tax=Luteolibacter sp. AS25 TaxID=3135776 RepID=UPI00398A5277
MKASRLIFENHGKPLEKIQFEDFILPSLQDGEVLISINAAPINPADLNYIEGTYGIKPELPATGGIECAGTVIDSKSSDFIEGDMVIPLKKVGGWASHAITTADNLIKLPSDIDPRQASMLKVNPATAWLLLQHFEKLVEGDTVVLNASNSGVGQCVIQVAASLGIRTICFLRNLSLEQELLNLGASIVLPDSAEGLDQARSEYGKAPASLAFNAVGGDSALRLLKLLKTGGTHITYGAMGLKPLTIPNGPLIFGDLRIRGLWVTKWMDSASPQDLKRVYDQLAEQVTNGSLIQKIDSTFKLSNFKEALLRLNADGRDGKILFKNT